MPRRHHRKLPTRVGYCSYCHKDSYPDEISASLALEALSKNPPRGAVEPVRFYKCPVTSRSNARFHLTSQPERTEHLPIQHSA